LWRGLADVVDRFVRKGSQLYIEGRLRTREWVDKDNIKRYTTEILADDMKLLGRRGDNAQGGAQQQPSSAGRPYSGYRQPYGGGASGWVSPVPYENSVVFGAAAVSVLLFSSSGYSSSERFTHSMPTRLNSSRPSSER